MPLGRSWMRKLAQLGVALAVAVGCATVARAEGPGIRVGDRVVFHPGIAAEFRYDDNIFFQSTNKTGAFMLRLLPTLDLATRPSERDAQPHSIDFRLRAGLDYREFLTGDSNVNRYRGFGVLFSGLLSILPSGPFSIDLYDNFNRTTQLPYNYVGQFPQLDRDTNELGARFRIRPGGRRLEIDLGYAFGIDFFENDPYKIFNLYRHTANLRALWRFFPKTAVYIDVNFQALQYVNPSPAMIDLATATEPARINSFPIRAIAGLNGLITTKLSFNAYIGYGNGLYAVGPNPNTAIGGLELRWRPTVLSDGALGYRHDFNNSLVGTYYDTDSVYISWAQQIWRFSAFARLQYSNLRFAGISSAFITPNNRTDNYLTFSFRFEYPFKPWLGLGLTYDLTYNNTNATLVSGAPVTALIPLDYLKNEVALRLTFAY